MMLRTDTRIVALIAGCALLAIFSPPAAAQQDKVRNVVILATGGTVAGTAAAATQVAGYTAAKDPVEQLIDALPDPKKLPNDKGEQVAQGASESITNDIWLTLPELASEQLEQPDLDRS